MKYAFTTEYDIDYQGITPDLTLTFPRFIQLLQETSIRHTDSTPFDMNWYAQNKRGFILLNWQAEVYGYPRFHDTLVVDTWPTLFKGMFAERAFQARDKAGRVLALANTFWIYTDLSTRKPTRIEPTLLEGYGAVQPHPLEKDFTMPAPDAQFSLYEERAYTVTRRDTDSNGHVNNVVYLEWAEDLILDSVYDTTRVKRMKAAYKKECVRGMTASVEAFTKGGNSGEYLFRISQKGEGIKELLAEVWMLRS